MQKDHILHRAQEKTQAGKVRYAAQSVDAPQSTAGSVCPNCGAQTESGQKFCEDCGCPLGMCQCAQCGHALEPGLALCPYCGAPTDHTHCSFCGEPMDDDEIFCSSCGNPRRGIVCPTCSTVNYRSFCRSCNTPLNEMAQEAIEKARRHPAVQRARQLNEEMERLQKEMEQLLQEYSTPGPADGREEATGGSSSALPPFDDEPQMTEEDRKQLERFYNLIGAASKQPVTAKRSPKPEPPTIPQQPAAPKTSIAERRKARLQQLLAEYEAKAKEMRATIDAMLPAPKDPPEEQRNFLCACLVETYRTTVMRERKNVGWVCNFCGCHHQQPSECSRPELGGKWLYREVETVTRIKQTVTTYW